jgi:hypothetical protein
MRRRDAPAGADFSDDAEQIGTIMDMSTAQRIDAGVVFDG